MSNISENGLVALTWSFTGVGIVMTIGRYIIRKKTMGRLDWDDLTHGLAVCFLLGYVSTYTAGFPRDYEVEFWAASKAEGDPKPPPSDSTMDMYVRYIIAVTLQFWVCVYLIKVSFLLFYRRLFGISRPFMKAWWAVLVFTVLTFLANFLATLWSCDTPDQLFVVKVCLSPIASYKTDQFVIMWCVLNIASDVAIMVLPLWMLRTLKMHLGQKLALAGLFLLVIIDIAFDIMRTIYTVNGGAFALDTLWDILEPTIAVIVSCLPTYYALVRPKPKPSSSYKPFAEPSSGYSKFSKFSKFSQYSSSGQRSNAVMSERDGIRTQISVETRVSDREFV